MPKRPIGRRKVGSERAHRNRRALERYGLSIARATWTALEQRIRQKQAVFLRRTSNSRTVWAVLYQPGDALDPRPMWLPVAYHNRSHQIVSVLPADMLEPYRDKLDPRLGRIPEPQPERSLL